MVQTHQRIVTRRAPPRRQSRAWQILALFLLFLVLGLTVVRDCLTDAPAQQAIAEADPDSVSAATVEPRPRAVTPVKTQTPATLKVDIEDEPEERGPAAPQPVKVAVKDEPEEGGAPTEVGPDVPVDPTPLISYDYELKTMRVGITAKVKTKDGEQVEKRITYRQDGSTNSTRLRVDFVDSELAPPDGLWKTRKQTLPDDPHSGGRLRTQSVFFQGLRKIQVTQLVEVVPSKQPVEVAPGVRKRLLDTVLVHYLIENKDNKAHRVGLRAMVDTFIGDNDGVPFAVPGLGEMVNTYKDFTDVARTGGQIPEYVQALEVPDLQNPGTVARMTLKLGGRFESPNRVSLTRWPLGDLPPGKPLKWDVPLKEMQDDSAVAIYWNERLLEPGARRKMGYGYGLGAVSSSEGGGKLGITLGGDFEPGQVFTVTTYVTNPIPGQTVELSLPEGLQNQDQARLPVPDGKGAPPTSIVTWKVKVLQTGEFRIRVTSSSGISQSKTITIARASGGHFTLTLDGSFAPGETFSAKAQVAEPLPGQTLKLILPPGLERVGGQESEAVPAPMGGDKGSTVAWQVKVRTPGKHVLRVQSSTGLIQTKTLSIDPEAGRFVIDIEPTTGLAPGKDITVIARVTNPLQGQTLTLVLPDPKLRREEGEATQSVPPLPPGTREGTVTVSWRVRILDQGQLPVRVHSSTDITKGKIIRVSPSGIFGS
jgi:hypothetical protein